MRVEHSVVINRPVEEVFQFMSDPRNNEQWQSMIVDTKGVEGPVGVGSKWQHTVSFLGRKFEPTFELTELEPNRRSAVRSAGGPVPFHGSWTFEPVDGGTRVSWVLEGEPGGFFRLAEPLVERAARRQTASDFATLKDLLEARA